MISKTEIFLIKRSVIIIFGLIILSLIVFKFNKEIINGLICGYLVSLLRLKVLAGTIKEIVSIRIKKTLKRSRFKYLLVQLLTVVILVVAIKVSILFFLSFFVGLISIQITILINSVTELIGITKNNFE